MKSVLRWVTSGARLAGLLIVVPAALAQQSPIYGERDLVHPVYGKSGMVATQEAEASRLGSRCSGTAATRSMPRRRSRSRSP